MTNKSLNIIFLVLIVAVILTLTWILGERHGAKKAFARAAGQLSSEQAQATIEQLQFTLRETEQELAEAISTVEATATRTRTLRNQLDEQMRVRGSDAIDLALYRRIETSEKARAIEVESVVWDPAQPSTLAVTLIQWQGRDRVTGELAVALIYGATATSGLSDSEEAGKIVSDLRVDLAPVSFDFRFFQKISLSISPAESDNSGSGKSRIQVPDYIDISIIPANERLRTIDTRLLWSDIAQ